MKRRLTFYLSGLAVLSLLLLGLGFYVFIVTEIPSVKGPEEPDEQTGEHDLRDA